MKRLFKLQFLLLLSLFTAACSDNDTPAEPTLPDNAFVAENIVFDFQPADNGTLTIYMHKPRFAAMMPPIEMRIRNIQYNAKGNCVYFGTEKVIPEAQLHGSEYMPFEKFVITNLKGKIEGKVCQLEFICAGTYQVHYDATVTAGEGNIQDGAWTEQLTTTGTLHTDTLQK